MYVGKNSYVCIYASYTRKHSLFHIYKHQNSITSPFFEAISSLAIEFLFVDGSNRFKPYNVQRYFMSFCVIFSFKLENGLVPQGIGKDEILYNTSLSKQIYQLHTPCSCDHISQVIDVSIYSQLLHDKLHHCNNSAQFDLVTFAGGMNTGGVV